jgi:hypothetical protein
MSAAEDAYRAEHERNQSVETLVSKIDNLVDIVAALAASTMNKRNDKSLDGKSLDGKSPDVESLLNVKPSPEVDDRRD